MTSPAPQSNLVAGVVAAVVGAIAATTAWTLIGVAFDGAQIGYGAIAVGALVGFLAAKVGGAEPALPIIAGALAAAACFIGDILIVAHFGAVDYTNAGEKTSWLGIVLNHRAELQDVFTASFEVISLLFYALAAVFGFRLATHFGAQAAAPATPWEPPTTGTWAAPTGDTTGDTDAGADAAPAGDLEPTAAVTDESDPALASVAATPVEAAGEPVAEELPAPPVSDQPHDHPHPH